MFDTSVSPSQVVLRRRIDELPRGRWIAAALTFIAALAVYYLTAHRSISWWNSPELALASSELGVIGPPGAVIPTILGWVAIHATWGLSDIFALNLLAAVIAALTSAAVLLAAYRVEHLSRRKTTAPENRRASVLICAAAIAAALGLALSETMWYYAREYTEYIVTPLFTMLIVGAMIRWWIAAPQTGGAGSLFLITLLIGLDFSVHRTNALLIPALIFWILLGFPRAILSINSWLAGLAGLLLGFGFYLVLIPMASADPFMNITDPSTLDRFWEYVTVKMRGGGFLVSLYPRNADFWSVQVADWLAAFTRAFAPFDTPFGILGFIPTLLGLVGIATLIRRSPRLGIALLLVFLSAAICAIAYFNIPGNYFRSLHRHYLPSLVIFGLFVVCGAVAFVRLVSHLRGPWGSSAAVVATILIISAPAAQITRNSPQLDASHDYFAHDYAGNMLASLPPDAILLTQGDNDTFPLWYLQQVENVRPDVTVLNIPLLNTGWFVRQSAERDPALHLDFTADELAEYGVLPWKDSTVTIPIDPTLNFGLSDSLALPNTLRLKVAPTIADTYLLGQDRAVLRLLTNTRFQRPLYVVGLADDQLPWLHPYLRHDGLVRRVVPVTDPPLNPDILRTNLLERYVYRGFDNPAAPFEAPTVWYVQNLLTAHATLAVLYLQSGDTTAARTVCDFLYRTLPTEHPQLPEQLTAHLNALCIQSEVAQ